jgi:hypothetical protein
MAWSLDVADRRRLVSALMQIDGMRTRSTRDMFLRALESELGYHLSFPRHDQDDFDLWELVGCCLGYAGAVHALVEVLDTFYRGSLAVGEVKALVAEVFDPLLSQAERKELRKLTMAVERTAPGMPALPVLYREAVGKVGPALGRRRLPDIVAQLEEVSSGADGLPPLLVFVSELAEHVNGEVAAALRDWAERFAGQRELGPVRARRPALDSGHTVYLVIECLPDGAGSGGFLTTAWLQYGSEPGEPGETLWCDDHPRRLSELSRLIETVIREDPRITGWAVHELTIEFVVPRALLNDPFDQLVINIDGLPRRVGIDYPVVVRSHDRLRGHTTHGRWLSHWNLLAGDPGAARVHWAHRPGEHAGEQLYAKLSDDVWACLAMAFPPWGGGLDGTLDEFWISVQAGTPIVVWCREGGDRFLPDLQALLDTEDLQTLPRRVLELRRQAVSTAKDADHLGLHLTLVFDDAKRFPAPYIRLGPPT